jgi:hypothetical protein
VEGGHVNEKQGKRRSRKLPNKPITAEALHSILKNVVRGRMNMPAQAELRELARILEGWRLIFENQATLDHRRRLQDDALTALARLGDLVFKIAALDEANFVDAVSASELPDVLRFLNTRLSESKEAHALIEQMERHPGLAYSPSGYGAKGWRWLAKVLPVDFVNAMKLANPTFAPGISHSGPVSRFIEAVVPILTGEHPSAASIATQMKTLRRSNNE